MKTYRIRVCCDGCGKIEELAIPSPAKVQIVTNFMLDYLKKQGWTHNDGRDYCPEHGKQGGK